jgi:hypothetical protein
MKTCSHISTMPFSAKMALPASGWLGRTGFHGDHLVIAFSAANISVGMNNKGAGR